MSAYLYAFHSIFLSIYLSICLPVSQGELNKLYFDFSDEIVSSSIILSVYMPTCHLFNLLLSFFLSILSAILGNITFFNRDASTLGQKPLYSKYDYILAYTTYNSRRMGSCGFPLGDKSAISSYNITMGSEPSLSPSFSSPVSPSPSIGSRSPSRSPSQTPIRPSRSPSRPNQSPSLSPTGSSPLFISLAPSRSPISSLSPSGSSPISPSLSPSSKNYPFLNPTFSPSSNSPSFSLNPKTAGSASSGVSGPGPCTLMALLSGMIMQQVIIYLSLVQFLLSHNCPSRLVISIIVYVLFLVRDLKFLS